VLWLHLTHCLDNKRLPRQYASSFPLARTYTVAYLLLEKLGDAPPLFGFFEQFGRYGPLFWEVIF